MRASFACVQRNARHIAQRFLQIGHTLLPDDLRGHDVDRLRCVEDFVGHDIERAALPGDDNRFIAIWVGGRGLSLRRGRGGQGREPDACRAQRF